MSTPSPATARDAACLVAIKLAAQLFLWLVLGFQILTVDEFLRLSIAVKVVHSWQWFPDLVFLPGMFWVYAIPMLLGAPLRAGAIVLTIGFGVGCTLLMHRILLLAGMSRRTAFAGALLLSLQPLALWLNGVPLAETGTAFFLLLGLQTLPSRHFSIRLAGAAALLMATMFRYEVWPLVALLAALQLDSRSLPSSSNLNLKRRLLIAAVSLVGIVSILLWRISAEHPFGPAEAAYAPLPDSDFAEMFPTFAYGSLGYVPLSIALLFVMVFKLVRRNLPDGFARILVWLGAVSAVVTYLLIQLAVLPVTFPVRIVYLPGLFVALAGLVLMEGWISRIGNKTLVLGSGVLMALFLVIAVRPPVEVKPETMRVAGRLRILLKTLPLENSILVERADLGWTVLWGLNDGSSRLVFDRTRFASQGVKVLGAEEVSPLSDPKTAAAYFGAHPELVCALGVAKPKVADMSKAVPASWTKMWADGKYTLWCARRLAGPGRVL